MPGTEHTATCTDCGVDYHLACLHELGGCATAGCAGSSWKEHGQATPQTQAPLDPQEQWRNFSVGRVVVARIVVLVGILSWPGLCVTALQTRSGVPSKGLQLLIAAFAMGGFFLPIVGLALGALVPLSWLNREDEEDETPSEPK